MQVDRRSGQVRNADVIRTKYGVAPEHIPDYLALVGDTADGYPGIAGIGTKTAASLVIATGPSRRFRLTYSDRIARSRCSSRRSRPCGRTHRLFTDVEQLRWTRATPSFPAVAEKFGEPRLLARVDDLAKQLGPQSVAEKSR